MSKLKFRGGEGNNNNECGNTVTVVKMKATSTTKTTRREKRSQTLGTTVGHHKQSKKQAKDKPRFTTIASETETLFRLSQEFSNCNWLERKIKQEKDKNRDSINEDSSAGAEDDAQDLIVDDYQNDAIVPCIAISEDLGDIKVSIEGCNRNTMDLTKKAPCIAISEDLGDIKVSVEGCDRNKMDLTKTELLKSVKEHNFLLGDILDDKDALNVESQLNKEIEQLTNTKQKFVDDLVEIRQKKNTTIKEVEDIRSKLAEGKEVLKSIRNKRKSSEAEETVHDLSYKRSPVSQTSNYPTHHSQDSHYGAQNQALYSQNPMPNFNFHQNYPNLSAAQYMPQPPQTLPYTSSSYDKYNQMKRMQSNCQTNDHRLSLLSQYNQYHQQYNLYGLGLPYTMPELYQASSPQQYHQYQQQVAQAPDPRQNGSKRNSACHVSACTVCGRPSNFLCSACQKVNYCTSRCQERDWIVHKKVCSNSHQQKKLAVSPFS